MILLDTSVWVALLREGRPISEEQLLKFVTCGPVVQEVLRGLRRGRAERAFLTGFLALPCISDPVPLRLYREAAEIYRDGRSKGYTIRSSADCLIAAIAIEQGVPVWHQDRDFARIAKYTRLEIWDDHGPRFPSPKGGSAT